MAGTLPPLFAITEDDHGGYVCVANYTLLILMVLLVVTRVFTRWYVVKFIKSDDVLLMVAAFLATLQSVFVQLAVNHGLGKRIKIVSDNDFVLYLKYEYAAQILIIAAMTAAKASLALLIQNLMAEGHSLLASRSLLGVIIGWGITSVFAIAFGCSLPHPWDTTGHCINLGALHDAISAINIATDAVLVLLPCLVFWTVQEHMRRYRVTALFAIRILVCVITGIQIHYYGRFLSSSDPTWSKMNSSILDQFMMNFSIICTAIPSLGRLIVELQPEVNAFAITEQHGLRNNDKYALSAFGNRLQRDYVLSNRLGVHTSVLGSRTSRNDHDAESVQGLRQDDMRQNSHVIKQTVGFEIKYGANQV